MIEDYIVEEVRRARAAIAEECGFDMKRIFAKAREIEATPPPSSPNKRVERTRRKRSVRVVSHGRRVAHP